MFHVSNMLPGSYFQLLVETRWKPDLRWTWVWEWPFPDLSITTLSYLILLYSILYPILIFSNSIPFLLSHFILILYPILPYPYLTFKLNSKSHCFKWKWSIKSFYEWHVSEGYDGHWSWILPFMIMWSRVAHPCPLFWKVRYF